MNDETERALSPANAEDAFDLTRLQIGQDFTESLGVKKALLTLPVRKPSQTRTLVRVHPAVPEIAEQIPGEVVVKPLFVAIDRQGGCVQMADPVRRAGQPAQRGESLGSRKSKTGTRRCRG